MINGNTIKIENDLYDIVKRIREIDKRYFVLYDKIGKKFQLHQKTPRGESYVLTFPFATLDARCVEHTLKTRIERFDKIMADIVKNNADLEYKATQKAKNEVNAQIEAYFR